MTHANTPRERRHATGYRSYGTPSRLLVLGRALRDDPEGSAKATDSTWTNFRGALKRFTADPLGHARVRASSAHGTVELEADDEGFVHGWLELERPLAHAGWQSVRLDLVGASGTRPGMAHVLVPAPTARFGVISDLDDTVLQSQVATPLHAARLMLFENARTRLPFSGVAAFYQALVAGATGDEGNPIFYVSSSPWNVHHVLADFLDAQGIPLGPLLLRDWDLGPSLARNAGHKMEKIQEIMDTFPALPFILVGDTSQEDPEIYAEVAHRFPGRVLAVYIRDVNASRPRRAAVEARAESLAHAGSTLLLAADTLVAARHAAERGWIDPARLPDIGEEKREDEGTIPGKAEPPLPAG